MKGITSTLFGFVSIRQALHIIHRNKWWWYALLPFCLMVVLYSIGLSLQREYEPTKAESLHEWVWGVAREIVSLALAFLLTKASKYLVIAALSPILSHLSSRTHTQLTQESFPFSFRRMFDDFKRSLQIILRNLRYEYLIYLMFYLVFWIFNLDRKSAAFIIPTFLVSAYFYGFAYVDYTLERLQLNVKESIKWVRTHWGFVLVIGIIYGLFIQLPIEIKGLFSIGKKTSFLFSFVQLAYLFLLSFTPILTVVAATYGVIQIQKKNS